RHSLDKRLRNKQAAEWLLVVKRHSRHFNGVAYRNVEPLDAIERQLLGNERAERLGQRELAWTYLDCHFPDAFEPQIRRIGGILDVLPSGITQRGIALNEPD